MAGHFLPPGAGVDLDFFGDHESRIEPDSKLADQVLVLLASLFQGFEKLFGSRVSDRSKAVHELVFGHSNAEILDRDGVGRVVRADFDLEIQIFVEDVLLSQFDVPDFLQGVGTIGYQFADEDLFLRVKRMNNDIQELLNFRLELMFFYIGWRS